MQLSSQQERFNFGDGFLPGFRHASNRGFLGPFGLFKTHRAARSLVPPGGPVTTRHGTATSVAPTKSAVAPQSPRHRVDVKDDKVLTDTLLTGGNKLLETHCTYYCTCLSHFEDI